jgi:hypothetical protein
MTEEKDFEALGRYVDANGNVLSLVSERNKLATEIEDMLRHTRIQDITVEGGIIGVFEHDQYLKKAVEIVQVNVDLDRSIREMNAYAPAANRLPVCCV